MEDDFMFSNIHTNNDLANKEDTQSHLSFNLNSTSNKHQVQSTNDANNLMQSVYYDVNNTNYYQQQLEQNESRIEELVNQLSVKDNQMSVLIEKLKQPNTTLDSTSNAGLNNSNLSSSPNDSARDNEISKLNVELEKLKEELRAKSEQNSELNSCLVKQTNFCENLSQLLKKSEEKNSYLEEQHSQSLATIRNLQIDLDTAKQELSSARFELSSKTIQEENLVKVIRFVCEYIKVYNLNKFEWLKQEALSQTQSINNLKLMCSQQEKTISDLVREMDAIKEERENEVEAQSKETQKVKITAQLKEEENYLLNDQIQKLSKSLDEERKQGGYLNKELGELKDFYKKLNEKNTSLIAQLEADNNEIKKRLVKLIKLVYRDFVINKIFFNFSIFNSDFWNN